MSWTEDSLTDEIKKAAAYWPELKRQEPKLARAILGCGSEFAARHVASRLTVKLLKSDEWEYLRSDVKHQLDKLTRFGLLEKSRPYMWCVYRLVPRRAQTLIVTDL